MNSDFTSFVCPQCKSEIQASSDMIGQKTECPACGQHLIIPDTRDDKITRYGADDDDLDNTQAMKSRTIRIDLGDF